jgi:hypothetical protein
VDGTDKSEEKSMIESILRRARARGRGIAIKVTDKVQPLAVEPLEQRAYMSAAGGPAELGCDVAESASQKYHLIELKRGYIAS